MPYRRPPRPCLLCDAAGAADSCPRCRAPLCLEHLPHAGARCAGCELEFQNKLAALPLWRWWCAGLSLALPAFYLMAGPLQEGWRVRVWAWGALTAGIALVEALIVAAASAALFAIVLVRARVSQERKLFLAE